MDDKADPPEPTPGAGGLTRPPSASQMRALGVLALVAMLALLRIALPVGVGVFLGVLIAFVLRPLDAWLRARRLGPGPAALVCAAGATVALFGVMGLVAVLLVARGAVLVRGLPAQLGTGGSLRVAAEHLLHRVPGVRLDVATVAARLQSEATSLGARAATLAAEAAGVTFGALLTLLFVALAVYSALRYWDQIVARAEVLLPFAPRHTHLLLEHFERVGQQVLRGTVITGLLQGGLAALGYWITGVPEPAFFGVLTAVASLVPAVGTLLVWVPAGLYLIGTHHVGAGIAELVFGAVVVVGVSDYLVRPRLVGSERDVPSIVTFVALFGGLEVFGLVGLVLGPVIVSLCVAVLRTYYAEKAREAKRVVTTA